jgi:hypothetical protein
MMEDWLGLKDGHFWMQRRQSSWRRWSRAILLVPRLARLLWGMYMEF